MKNTVRYLCLLGGLLAFWSISLSIPDQPAGEPGSRWHAVEIELVGGTINPGQPLSGSTDIEQDARLWKERSLHPMLMGLMLLPDMRVFEGSSAPGRMVPAAARQEKEEHNVDGLWKYETIRQRGGKEVPLTGLFLFQKGRFIQNAIHGGTPFDSQLGQAHEGTYQWDGRTLRLLARIGIIVDPTHTPPVTSRNNSRHELQTKRSGGTLTLHFGTGTVQRLSRVGPAEGTIIDLKGGVLGLVDGHFLLVFEASESDLVGASGTFTRSGENLHLNAWRWFRVNGSKVEYARDRYFSARLTSEALELGRGLMLRRKGSGSPTSSSR